MRALLRQPIDIAMKDCWDPFTFLPLLIFVRKSVIATAEHASLSKPLIGRCGGIGGSWKKATASFYIVVTNFATVMGSMIAAVEILPKCLGFLSTAQLFAGFTGNSHRLPSCLGGHYVTACHLT